MRFRGFIKKIVKKEIGVIIYIWHAIEIRRDSAYYDISLESHNKKKGRNSIFIIPFGLEVSP